jgi:2'-5' RNA ligase
MKPPDESWRLFVAIELPASLRARVHDHIDRLRHTVPDARVSWAREENFHLTLKFLGDTPVSKVAALSTAIERAAAKVPPFDANVGGCGAFPLRGQPRVLWLGIGDPTGRLAKLSHALEDECDQAGFGPEVRPFHPHLTVARLRRPHGAHRLAEVHKEMGFDPVPFSVRDLCLIRSELSSEGSRYTVVARHGFAPD